MKQIQTHTDRSALWKPLTAITAILIVFGLTVPVSLDGQGRGGPGAPAGPGGGRGPGGPGAAAPLPAQPTAVTLPTFTEITGPGPMFDSAPSHAPNRGPDHFRYETKEYWVSGTANGQPYRTRMVVRRPGANTRFSGLVLMEAMHPSGAAHMFESTAIYTMTSGHAAVEVVVHPQATARFTTLNEARYKGFQLAAPQTNEILAQTGALVRAASGPLGGETVRHIVLGGTSATAATLVGYLPAHMVYRTPEMREIYDGYLPNARADVEPRVNVPMIFVPTMNEVDTLAITRRQDGDEGDNKFRVYEFPGMVHIDMRDNVRLKPNPCTQPLNRFPLQAYVSVALHHLLEWVEKGTPAPRAERIWVTRNEQGMIAVDAHGNPRGGIRNTYVDVPVARYVARNTPADPPVPGTSPLFVPQLCGLGGYETAFTQQQLRQLYGTKRNYVSRVQQRLTELEREGWSLPVYRDMILADANAVNF
jgi:hypothetical protein